MSTEPLDPASADPTREGLDTPSEIIDARRADAAERRLRGALREIKQRTEHVVDDVRGLALPARVAGAAVLAGLGAVALVTVVRRSRRKRRPRSVASAVGRSLVAEFAVRMALGAAGVIGARLASDLLLPALLPQHAPPEGAAPRSRRPVSRVSKRAADVA